MDYNPNMSDTEFDKFVEQFPFLALQHASYRITSKQLGNLYLTHSLEVMKYCSNSLTDDQFVYCIRKYPGMALKLVRGKLSPGQFAYCVKKAPDEALLYAYDFLNNEQLAYCKTNNNVVN